MGGVGRSRVRAADGRRHRGRIRAEVQGDVRKFAVLPASGLTH